MHFKIFKMIATRGFLTAVECTKSVFGRGSARTPLRELTTLPRPPNRLRRGTPPPHSPPPRRVRRLGLVACGDSSSAPSAPRSPNPLRIFFLDTALTLGCVLCTVTCSGEPPRVLISSLLVRLRVRCDNILINRHTMYMKTSYKE